MTKADLDAYQHEVIVGGAKGLAGGLALALPASFLLYRRFPYYRSLQPSLKALGVIVVAVPACVISAEHAGQRYERSQWCAILSYSLRFVLDRRLGDAPRRGAGQAELETVRAREEAKWESMSPAQRASDYVRRHQYGVIVGSWAAAMAGACAYVMRDP